MIPQSFIDDLVNQTDLVDFLRADGGLDLKKRGNSYKCCCPFHNEKTPSFNVSQGKNFYYCFGCGAKGNVISFLMDRDGMTFIEAIKYLADRNGVEVPEERKLSPREIARQKAQKAKKEEAKSVLELACDAYENALVKNPRAMGYFKERGLSDQAIMFWHLGYAPNERNYLAKFFRDYPSDRLMDAGLIQESSGGRGGIIDRFRNRVMFPIRDRQNKIVGFGGRVTDDGGPKYLNSPETDLFKKSELLFGLAENQKDINQAKKIMVVEGYMDVIGLWTRGVRYAVATLGTAFTEKHASTLLRQSENIFFCFDGDNAGRNAAWKAVKVLLPVIKEIPNIRFVFLSKEEDPDSFTKKFGKEAFERKVESDGIIMSRYIVDHILSDKNLQTSEGIHQSIHEAAEVFMEFNSQIESYRSLVKEDFVKRLSYLSHSRLEDIRPTMDMVLRNMEERQVIQEARRLKAAQMSEERRAAENGRPGESARSRPGESAPRGSFGARDGGGGFQRGGNYQQRREPRFERGSFREATPFRRGAGLVEQIDKLCMTQLSFLARWPEFAIHVDLPEYCDGSEEMEAMYDLTERLRTKPNPTMEDIVSDAIEEGSPFANVYAHYLKRGKIDEAKEIIDNGGKPLDKADYKNKELAFIDGNKRLRDNILNLIFYKTQQEKAGKLSKMDMLFLREIRQEGQGGPVGGDGDGRNIRDAGNHYGK